MMRGIEGMFYDTAKNDHGLPHNPFRACVVPRPIGWISTLSKDGIPNLAPFSMYNHLGYDPPYVFFAGGNRPGTDQRKDSVVNAEETGEFVVNIATYDLRDKVAMTGLIYPPDVDEFEVAGLTKAPSTMVKPWRIAESPIHFECRYHSTVSIPANRPDTIHHAVIGEVVGIHIDDSVITADGQVDILKVRPLARMGYLDYTSVTDVFTIPVVGNEAAHIGEAVPKKDMGPRA